MVQIESIDNGWIVTRQPQGTMHACADLQELFDYLLLVVAGKSEGFGGSMYAKVTVKESNGN